MKGIPDVCFATSDIALPREGSLDDEAKFLTFGEAACNFVS